MNMKGTHMQPLPRTADILVRSNVNLPRGVIAVHTLSKSIARNFTGQTIAPVHSERLRTILERLCDPGIAADKNVRGPGKGLLRAAASSYVPSLNQHPTLNV